MINDHSQKYYILFFSIHFIFSHIHKSIQNIIFCAHLIPILLLYSTSIKNLWVTKVISEIIQFFLRKTVDPQPGSVDLSIH